MTTREEALKWLFPDAGLLARLERMSVAAKGRVRGTLQGKRRSRTLGSSLEFADYRPYVPGDDIRRLDWNVYGRTGKAFVRQYWDEQEISVRLYIDVSPSMRFQRDGANPADGKAALDSNKLAYALRLAACVGYASLSGEDRVGATVFANERTDGLPPLFGKASAARLFAFLAGAWSAEEAVGPTSGTDGRSDLGLFRAHGGALPRKPGQTWLFTDGLYERGLEETLSALLACGQEVVFVHLLGPEELRPELFGELKLIDVETRESKEVAIGEGVLASYRATVRAHSEYIRRLCMERGFTYLFVDTGVPLEDAAIRMLLAEGLLRA